MLHLAVSLISIDLSVVLYTYMCAGVHVCALPVFPAVPAVSMQAHIHSPLCYSVMLNVKNVKILFLIPQFCICSFDWYTTTLLYLTFLHL